MTQESLIRDSLIALLRGLPLVAIGLLLIASIWLFPIGLILVICSGIPLARVQLRQIREEAENLEYEE